MDLLSNSRVGLRIVGRAAAGQHVVAPVGGGQMRLYFRGTEWATVPATLVNTAGDLTIGTNSPQHTDDFDGMIDRVRIWSVERTQQQICAEYSGGGC